MFKVIETTALRVPAGLLGPGERMYHSVLQVAERPWFHISYAVKSNRGEVLESMLCGHVEQLAEFVDAGNHGIQIVAVQLVCPGWLSGSEYWAMHSLDSVEKTFDDEGVKEIYRLTDGTILECPSYGSGPSSKGRPVEIVFKRHHKS